MRPSGKWSRRETTYDLQKRVDQIIGDYMVVVKISKTINAHEEAAKLRNYIMAKAIFFEFRRPIVYPQAKVTEKKDLIQKCLDINSWKLFNINRKPDFTHAANYRKQVNTATLYQIIENGGAYIGPRRAALFAEEMRLDQSIPVMYGVDFRDTYLKQFISKYGKGLSDDMRCVVNYFQTADHTLKNPKFMTLGNVRAKLKL